MLMIMTSGYDNGDGLSTRVVASLAPRPKSHTGSALSNSFYGSVCVISNTAPGKYSKSTLWTVSSILVCFESECYEFLTLYLKKTK